MYKRCVFSSTAYRYSEDKHDTSVKFRNLCILLVQFMQSVIFINAFPHPVNIDVVLEIEQLLGGRV